MNDPHHGPQPTDLAGWALKYAATGIAVFPVNPETKAPIGATEDYFFQISISILMNKFVSDKI